MSFQTSRYFRLTDFSVLCHFDLCSFRSYVISPIGYLTKIILTFWIFRTNVISSIGLFGVMSFQPLFFSILCYFDLRTYNHKSIRPFGKFVPMLFRTWDFSVLCHFDLRTFRSYVISTFSLSTFKLFAFRPSDFFILGDIDL